MDELGLLMNVSHDGERCFRATADGASVPWAADVSDAALERLIRDLASEDPAATARSQLWNQPGAYAGR
jgi:hypothetical protein